MSSSLFIAGTDTNVGKTIVTAGLAAYLRSRQIDAGVMKPLESGCMSGATASDSAYLKAISESKDDLDLINTYAFEKPLAPGVAAELEGVEISFDHISESYKRLGLLHSLVLVEGAGGIMVPASKDKNMADLAQALDLPILLVARSGLGTINHTLLTLDYLDRRGIPVVGIVFNRQDKQGDPSEEFNRQTLERYTSVPIWGTMGHVGKVKDRVEIVSKLREGLGEAVDLFFNIKPLQAIG